MLKRDAGTVRVYALKIHNTRSVLPRIGLPSNPMIRNLVGDFGGPFFFFSADLGQTMKTFVVELFDLFHSLHKAGKLLNWVH